jgi:hypothetical protein
MLMEPQEFSRVWKRLLPGLCLLVILVLVGFAPLPAAAQSALMYAPMQKMGQATSATLQNAGSKIPTSEAATPQSHGKIIASPGLAPGQGRIVRDRKPLRHYCFNFWTNGLPKGSDPTEAYWFETRNGKLMLVDPRITQRYSHMPR